MIAERIALVLVVLVLGAIELGWCVGLLILLRYGLA